MGDAMNLLIAILAAGFGLLILIWALVPFAPIVGAWLRSRQPAPTCGNCRYFTRYLDGTFCDRRAIWRMANDPACNIGEVKS